MTPDGLLVKHGRIHAQTRDRAGAIADTVLADGWVLCEGGKIVALGEGRVHPGAAVTVDAAGMDVVPGLIDMHTHGGNGADYTDPTIEAWETATRYAARHGITSVQATTTSMQMPAIRDSLELARVWMARPHPENSTVLGVHLEGPWLSEIRRGCHPIPNLRMPSAEDTDFVLSYRDVVTEVTLAPELPGGLEMTQRLAGAGILVAAGHSDIYDDDILRAIDAGVRHVTHLYACTSSMKNEKGRRMIGLVEMALTRPELTVEIIGDGKHLHPVVIQIVARCKGEEGWCVISDCMAGTGLPDGSATSICGVPAIVKGGVGILADLSAWAGSATPLDQDLRNVVQLAEIPLEKAIHAFTRVPARMLGLAGRKGCVAIGADADLTILDGDLEVRRTIVAGRSVHEA